ncbi:protein kinase [Kitasatospora sp. NPDC051914]|uniref:serine/threonine-protein kinase n=1 Tax=Kitasatospora sp. NPDC051914 TaxID=3154945 RepID=UPI00342D300C
MAGRMLSDRYELEELLGRGGMGEVWAARDHLIRRRVAVKLLHPQRDADSAEELFFREARTAGGLNHPGVVTIFDLGTDTDGTPFLVMELLAGRDLGTVLRQDGPPEPAVAVEWATQVADALAVAHAAGVVHRDLKPANLMLTTAGSVKILDFGIARYLSTVTKASRIIGTPAYMPPERLEGKAGDGRADLYALGCVLHELLTGRSPFGDLDAAALMFAHIGRVAAPPSAHRPGVSATLDLLVADLLAKKPEHRPTTAAEVADRLRAMAVAPPRPRTAEPGPAVVEPVPTAVDGGPREAVPIPTAVDPDRDRRGPAQATTRDATGRGAVAVQTPPAEPAEPAEQETPAESADSPPPAETAPETDEKPRKPAMSRPRSVVGALLLLFLPAVTVWVTSGFTHAYQAEPGPAVWKLVVYAVVALPALVLAGLPAVVAYSVMSVDREEPGWLVALGPSVLFLGCPVVFVLSLIDPGWFGVLGTSAAVVPRLLGLV